MNAAFAGSVLGRQADRVPTHGVEDIVAAGASIPTYDPLPLEREPNCTG